MVFVKMGLQIKQICRLCLKEARDECEEINELVKRMLDALLLPLDMDVSSDPIICEDCVGVAKKCCYFKSACLNTEKIILLFSISAKGSKHDINVICEDVERIESATKKRDICRFCMAPTENYNFAPLDTLMNDDMLEMLSKYMPEMDFNIIENPIVCEICRENLKEYFKFVLKCLDVEEKIKTYLEEEGISSMGKIQLNKFHFLSNNVLEYRVDIHSQICATKDKSISLNNKESFYPHRLSGLIKHELDIKEEDVIFEENTTYDSRSEIKSNIYDNASSCDEYDKYVKQNIIPLKTEHSPEICTYQGNVETSKQTLIHDNTLDIREYKCPLCGYESKRKDNLKKHMLVHKDTSEIQMYKCSLCTFETKHQTNLNQHMLIHRSISEIKMHKCLLCAYEAKRKNGLARHMLVHKDISEVESYKCSLCSFESKHKNSLTNHMLVHKEFSEIETYKCPLCPHVAKRKGHLKIHMLVHKDTSEIEMYKCTLCTFETKHKGNVKKHYLLVHKEVSKIKK